MYVELNKHLSYIKKKEEKNPVSRRLRPTAVQENIDAKHQIRRP